MTDNKEESIFDMIDRGVAPNEAFAQIHSTEEKSKGLPEGYDPETMKFELTEEEKKADKKSKENYTYNEKTGEFENAPEQKIEIKEKSKGLPKGYDPETMKFELTEDEKKADNQLRIKKLKEKTEKKSKEDYTYNERTGEFEISKKSQEELKPGYTYNETTGEFENPKEKVDKLRGKSDKKAETFKSQEDIQQALEAAQERNADSSANTIANIATVKHLQNKRRK